MTRARSHSTPPRRLPPRAAEPPFFRRSDAPAALLILALAVAPWLPPAHAFQWKVQLVLTEMGVWFGGAALVGALACGIRKRRGLGTFFTASVFALAAFLFFQPWVQFFSERRLWPVALGTVFRGDRSGAAVSRPPAAPPGAVTAPVQHLSYRTADGVERHMVFYPPAGQKPAPFVVVGHTGGWDGGDPGEFRWFHEFLARQGWAVAVPAYRLAPADPWPAARDDLWAAADQLKARAAELNLDPTRYAFLGRSAGGHLALAAAYQRMDPALKGVLAFYAPADLRFAYVHSREDDIVRSPHLLRQLMGGPLSEKEEAYDGASPIRFITPASPPTLLLHGTRDPLTWVKQSQRLAEWGFRQNARVLHIELPWATHGFDYFPTGPGGWAARETTAWFLTYVFSEDKK